MRRAVAGIVRGARFAGRGSVGLCLSYAACLWAALLVIALLDAIVFRPLPVAAEGEMRVVREHVAIGTRTGQWTWPSGARASYLSARLHDHVVGIAALASPATVVVTADGTRVAVSGAIVSANTLDVLRPVRLSCGHSNHLAARAHLPSDAVLSRGLAAALFGNPVRACGRRLAVDGTDHVVAAVLDAPFPWFAQVDVWSAAAPEALAAAPSVDLLVRADADAWRRIEPRLPELGREAAAAHAPPAPLLVQGAFAEPLRPLIEGDTSRVRLILSLVLALIVIAGAGHVALCLLSRADAAIDDVRLRVSLGGRVRDVVYEQAGHQLVVMTTAVVAAAMLTGLSLPVVDRLLPDALLWNGGLAWPAPRVLAAVIAAALGTALAVAAAIGAASGLAATRSVSHVLGSGRHTQPGSPRARYVVLALQGAIVACVITSALGVWTYAADLARRDIGFDAAHLWAVDVRPPADDARDRALRSAYYAGLLQAASNWPGQHGAALATSHPLGDVEARVRASTDCGSSTVELTALERGVTAGYFEVLGIPLLAGRSFSARPGAPGAPLELVVNLAFAEAACGGRWPVGRTIALVSGSRTLAGHIVGVSGNTTRRALRPATPEAYVPLIEGPTLTASLLVRSSDPGLRDTLARLVVDANPAQALGLGEPTQVSDVAVGVRQAPVAYASLLGMLAMLAVALAIGGVTALAAVLVTSRRREMGIRQALGATPQQVLAALTARLCIALGLGGSIGAMAGLLVRTPVWNAAGTPPPAFVLLLVAVSGVAVLVPGVLTAAHALRRPIVDMLNSH